MTWYFYIGLIASVGISIFTLPQLIAIIKTKNTAFINIPMYVIYLIGCTCFFIGGCLMTVGIGIGDNPSPTDKLSSGLPLIIAQGVCGIISSTIFILKLKNYFTARKTKITELEYCNRLKMLTDDYRKQKKNLSMGGTSTNDKEVI